MVCLCINNCDCSHFFQSSSEARFTIYKVYYLRDNHQFEINSFKIIIDYSE